MAFGNLQPKPPKEGTIVFHPICPDEYNLPDHMAQMAQQFGFRPMHTDYQCGACGKTTNGRVLCDMVRTADGARISWCICSCNRQEPSVIVEKGGTIIAQLPLSKLFHAGDKWPTSLARLYEEAAKSYSAGAFTSTAMTCRKLLMVCACEEGEKDGKTFQEYVGYIITNVLTFSKAKDAIDAIRSIGNEANHDVQFVAEPDAKRAMEIVTYMLNTIYSLPSA